MDKIRKAEAKKANQCVTDLLLSMLDELKEKSV